MVLYTTIPDRMQNIGRAKSLSHMELQMRSRSVSCSIFNMVLGHDGRRTCMLRQAVLFSLGEEHIVTSLANKL